ncbi:MAG TPA: hypothetical protein VFZ00_25460 [Solirubrobacter sp.]|nr:hypothetical protein [Solirubrobacter sp.]
MIERAHCESGGGGERHDEAGLLLGTEFAAEFVRVEQTAPTRCVVAL